MPIRPFIKWVGGKRNKLPQILSLCPPKFNTYHEPMVGGGAVFFSLEPKRALLNDLNADLVETYQVVRDQPTQLIKALKTMKNTEEDYKIVRAQKRKTPVTRAARFIYLNKLSFNGLYRVNSSGQFNVPYCKDSTRAHFDADLILEASRLLQNVTVTSEDYLSALLKVKAKDLVFIDPPYDGTFTGYTSGGFSKEDQIRLKEALDYLSDIKAYVIICNSDTAFIRELYKDYNKIYIQDRFMVAAKGSSRIPKSTLFVTNFSF